MAWDNDYEARKECECGFEGSVVVMIRGDQEKWECPRCGELHQATVEDDPDETTRDGCD